MNRVLLRAALLGVFLTTAIGLSAQGIRSDYLDLPLPGQWQVVTGDGATGVQTYYDAQSGSLLQIGALAGMQKVAEISKYFQHPDQAGPPFHNSLQTWLSRCPTPTAIAFPKTW